MACYLLIHGNRHGKWAWEKVVNLLECHGHLVFEVDAGHDVMLSQPQTLVNILETVALAQR